jgi:hypothetical protein
MRLEEIKEKFKDEWVILEVLKEDEIGQPIEGKVIAHSRERDEVYKKQREMEGDIAVFYAGEVPKEGYAVAFYA